jgi:5-methylthioadenosine/S-adenosylhomocysteine deaminase
MKRILIHGAAILTIDPKIGDLRGDILIEGVRIVAVAPSIPADDSEIIPAERMIALPASSVPTA